jgi:hypothetical protein
MKAIGLHTCGGPEVRVHAAAVPRIAKMIYVPLAEFLAPHAAISPPPEPSPLEGEGWEGGRVTGGVFIAPGT